jgi:hypothetical protein
MNVLYNSSNYHVVEFPGLGYELINKYTSAGTYLHGEAGARFKAHLAEVLAADDSEEAVDEFLGNFDSFMHQPAIYH